MGPIDLRLADDSNLALRVGMITQTQGKLGTKT